MKLSVDRQEKKGFFGGSFYETSIRATLTDQETKVAYEQRIMDLALIGDGDVSSDDTGKLLHLCNRTRLSMSDLTLGIIAKANDASQLGMLAWLENRVRERCKEFKSIIETAMNNKEAMNQSYEEEF